MESDINQANDAPHTANAVISLDQRDEDGFSLADRLPAGETGFDLAEQREDLRRALAVLTV